MNIKDKIINIVLNIIPILVMIWLISVIQNDYVLTAVYVGIILISFYLKKEKGDIFIFLFGFCAMILSEMVFVSTGVETFVRNTLFGLMPLWLPFLWGYGFVVIKRGIDILNIKKQITKVVVGVIIFKDKKVLIGKRRRKHGDGEYSFPGGAVEHGESFEDCVRREVLEESGIEIKNIKFLSVANSTKLFGIHEVQVHFKAEWESGEARDLPEERIGDWQWYDLDKIPEPFFFPAQITFESYKTGKNYFDLK